MKTKSIQEIELKNRIKEKQKKLKKLEMFINNISYKPLDFSFYINIKIIKKLLNDIIKI